MPMGLWLIGIFVSKNRKDDVYLNRNPKENTARFEMRLKPSEKAKLERLAQKCGLSLSEYLKQRGLGYEPRTIPPDLFHAFHGDLCRLANQLRDGRGSEAEAAVLELLREIQSELMLPGRQSTSQVVKEVRTWQQPASGPSRESSQT